MGEHARKKDLNASKPRAVSSRNWQKEDTVSIPDRISALEIRLKVQREEEARAARIEELKAQVNAGTYTMDSKAIAREMLKSPTTMKMLGLGKHDLFELKDEE